MRITWSPSEMNRTTIEIFYRIVTPRVKMLLGRLDICIFIMRLHANRKKFDGDKDATRCSSYLDYRRHRNHRLSLLKWNDWSTRRQQTLRSVNSKWVMASYELLTKSYRETNKHCNQHQQIYERYFATCAGLTSFSEMFVSTAVLMMTKHQSFGVTNFHWTKAQA